MPFYHEVVLLVVVVMVVAAVIVVIWLHQWQYGWAAVVLVEVGL